MRPKTRLPSPYILVVDDYRDGREMLVEYLTFRGHEVLQAPDGEVALAMVRRRLPHVVLLDMAMPGLDGLDVVKALKADSQTRDAIVIAVSARALVPDQATAMAAGCDAYIPKPFDLAVLGEAIDALMAEGVSALPRLKAVQQFGGVRTSRTRVASAGS